MQKNKVMIVNLCYYLHVMTVMSLYFIRHIQSSHADNNISNYRKKIIVNLECSLVLERIRKGMCAA